MEACVEYVSSAVQAQEGGACRLELCAALTEGGLTPSVGLLKMVKAKVSIPVYVMIRPRSGLDFIYSQDEIEQMLHDIKFLRDNGADGFVFGVLTKEMKVNKEACKRLLSETKSLPTTFHRAFDVTSNPFEALQDIIQLGFQCILTSGQQSSAKLGSSLIKKLIDQSEGRIQIMPGCGINEDNLKEILSTTGAKLFHGTARERCKLEVPKATLELGHGQDESVIYVTSAEKVKRLLSIYNDCINTQ